VTAPATRVRLGMNHPREAPTSSPTEVAAPVLTRRRGPSPRTVLVIASLGSAVAFVDATIVNIAFPSIERSFHGTSISSLSWVLNAYNIVFAAFLVAAGRLADLLGRRRTFVFGLELFSAASLLCALAPSADALIEFRIVQALGAALLVPASLALVLHAFPPERRSHGVALLSAVAAIAAGLGPSIGGLLVAATSWRLVFVVNLPIGAAAIVLARRHLIESRASGRRRIPDLPGAVTFGVGTAALVLGIVEGQRWGWTSPGIVGSFVIAGCLIGITVWRSTWHRSPIIELSLLRVRTFRVANAMTVIGAAGYYGYTLTNVLFLTSVWHYSVLRAGLALTPGPFVAAAVAGPTSRLVQRFGHRPVLVAGGLIWGGAVMWLVIEVGTTPAFLTQWLPGIVLLGIGAGTLFPNMTSAAVASAPDNSFATAIGLNSVARQVGAALGVATIVAVIGTPSSINLPAAFHHAWTFAAFCLLAAGLGSLWVDRLPVDSAPALADAARLVLRRDATGGQQSPVTVPARARRAIIRDAAQPCGARSESPAEFLAHVPLFSGVAPSSCRKLAARVKHVHLAAGKWLFHQGDPGDALYVVRAGRLAVVDEEAEVVLREVGRGDAIGELALLDGSPRAASVRATRDTDLLAIAATDFYESLRRTPTLSLAISRTLADMLREVRAPAPTARPRPTTVALVALDDTIPHEELAQGLAGALSSYLSSTLLRGDEALVSKSRLDHPAVVYGPVLDQAEAGHELVLLAAGSAVTPGPWTQFCLQQADRILAVTSGGPVPEAVQQRTELRGCDLVAYEVTPGSPGLQGWASVLDPVESHTLRRRGLVDDLARMARRLSGRSVGIVLSGGGARAFSHIGVLEELISAGVTIDRVAGVSMGAFIGALFAKGCNPEEIDACCFEEWVQRRPLNDFTLPRHSLIRGERFRTMLRRTFGEATIEQLPLSFMCGCTELRSGQFVVSRHGPLWEAVGFSLCLPVIAPPQVRGKNMFIDGSLLDNLPVKAMAELGEGPIIAVDVKASLNRPAEDATVHTESARANELPPRIAETMARVLLLASADTSEAARRHAKLVITPRAEGVGLLEFHQLDTARAAGRAAAQAALQNATTDLFP
jgi:NTE family protein